MKPYKKRIKGPILKWCDSCNKTYGLQFFLPDVNGTHKRGVICKYCRDIQSKKDKLEQIKNRLKDYAKAEHISVEELIKIYEKQNKSCAVCFQEFPVEKISKRNGLFVDHCHTSGKVRGLLCLKCNSGLGMFNDNINLLTNALEYLKIYK